MFWWLMRWNGLSIMCCTLVPIWQVCPLHHYKEYLCVLLLYGWCCCGENFYCVYNTCYEEFVRVILLGEG